MTTTTELPLIESFLQPIRTDAPAGDPLRYTSVYDEIQAARSSDDNLPMGAWQREAKRADWAQVEQLAGNALITRSKDLQIALWLSEAWAHRFGLAGVLSSLHLLTGLHQHFAQTMFPCEPEAESLSADVIEHRTNLLHIYNQRTALRLRFIPIAAPADTHTAYSLADLEQARFKDQVSRREQQASNVQYLDSNMTDPLAVFTASDAATPVEFYVALSAQVTQATASTRALDALLDATYGDENTGLGGIIKALEAIQQHITPRLPKVVSRAAAAAEGVKIVVRSAAAYVNEVFSPVGDEADEIGYDGGANPQSNPIKPEQTVDSYSSPGVWRTVPASRTEAYEQIAQIAEYLAQIEPHSPVPSLLRKAIRWGALSFPDLFAELLQHPEDLQEYQQSLSSDRNL